MARSARERSKTGECTRGYHNSRDGNSTGRGRSLEWRLHPYSAIHSANESLCRNRGASAVDPSADPLCHTAIVSTPGSSCQRCSTPLDDTNATQSHRCFDYRRPCSTSQSGGKQAARRLGGTSAAARRGGSRSGGDGDSASGPAGQRVRPSGGNERGACSMCGCDAFGGSGGRGEARGAESPQ